MNREPDLHGIRRSVELAGRLSDGLVRLGPLSLGLDGVLDWVPGLGEAYSLAAGAFIVGQGARAGVPTRTLAVAAALMLGRTAITAVPLAGPLAADLLTSHRFAARMICTAIDKKLEAKGAKAARGPLWRRRRGDDLAAA
ncbi:MAG: DUF4112 domain-containing protein [Caulobacteraceae bacterium]|nr:DUF4112 domain-containing protein [Caulobacteraceae bacterium]